MNVYLHILITMHLLAMVYSLFVGQDLKEKLVSVGLLIIQVLLIFGAVGVFE